MEIRTKEPIAHASELDATFELRMSEDFAAHALAAHLSGVNLYSGLCCQ